MTNNLEDAQRKKSSAKTNRDLAIELEDASLYDEALEELDQARELLLEELSSFKNVQLKGNEVLSKHIQTVASEIADCFGISGGIYRRMGNINKALEMYEQGCLYEKDSTYKIQNSYNLGNSIVLKILNNVNISEISSDIQEAISVILKQIDATRRNDWWAWGDLGMLYLLNNQEDLAIEAYRKVKDLGAKESAIESMVNVLVALNERLKETNPDVSSSITKSISFMSHEPLKK